MRLPQCSSYVLRFTLYVLRLARLDPDRSIRQQRDRAGPLDGRGEFTMVRRAGAGDTTGDNLSPFRDRIYQDAGLFVVDDCCFVGTEPAHLAAQSAASGKLIVARWPSPDLSPFCSRHTLVPYRFVNLREGAYIGRPPLVTVLGYSINRTIWATISYLLWLMPP